MAIRTRWYLATASIDPLTGRPTHMLLTAAGDDAFAMTHWRPSRLAPTVALVRITQDTALLDTMEALPQFALECVALRVGQNWSVVAASPVVALARTAFGLTNADVTGKVIAAVIDTCVVKVLGAGTPRGHSSIARFAPFIGLED